MLLGLVLATSGHDRGARARRCPRAAREVLPQVGALVEGPAAYAHLSGRANLALFDAMGPGGRRRSRAGRDRRRAGPGRARRRRPAAGAGLLAGHAAAARPGRRAAAAAAAAGPRRADQRPRPAGHPRDPRPAARAERRRDDRLPVQPPARRGRAALHPGRRPRPRAGWCSRTSSPRCSGPPGGSLCTRRTRPRRGALLDGRVERGDGDRLLVRGDDAARRSTPGWCGGGVRGRRARASSGAASRRWCSTRDQCRRRTGWARSMIAVELRKLLRQPAHLGDDRCSSTRCRRWSRCCSR